MRNPEPSTIVFPSEPAKPVEEVEQRAAPGPFAFARWAALIYILATGLAEALFIELYCHWHGAQFLFPDPRHLYSADNIYKLSHIDFVARVGPEATDAPTVMSMTAEILMWSSLGIWAQRVSSMVKRYDETAPNPPHDLASYIATLGCQTGVVAGVLILLELSNFKVFNVSVNNFEAMVGLAFLLGYFGDETIDFFGQLRTSLFKGKAGKEK